MSAKSSELIMDMARQPDRLHNFDLVVAYRESGLPPSTRRYKNEQFSEWEDELTDPPPPYSSYDLSNTLFIDDHANISATCKVWHTASGTAPLVLFNCNSCNSQVDFVLFPESNDNDLDLDDDTGSISSGSSTSSSIVSCGSEISLSSMSSASIRPASSPIDQPAHILTPCGLASGKQDDVCQQWKEGIVHDWLEDVTHPDQEEVVDLAVDVVADLPTGQSWRQGLACDPAQAYVSK